MKKNLITVLMVLLISVNTIAQENEPLYKKSNASVENRISDLLNRMTLKEKIAQLSEAGCDDMKEDNNVKSSNFIEGKYKNGIGAIHGFKLSTKEYARVVNQIQKFLTKETRLGIPALFLSESLHGLVQDGATIFPQEINMGSSWNPELVFEIGSAIREEVKAVGVSQVLSPDLDVSRELRWGRVEETYGEDPYLVSRMGVNMIKGLQEGKTPDGTYIIATAKHFLAYCNPLGGLNLASSPGGVYDLYNTYLPSFKAAIQEANVLSVMSSYNSYNGEALCASKRIYTNLLRDELGFKGYVYSDWGSIGMLHNFHKVADSYTKAGKLAIEAGVDLEAPSLQCFKHLDSLVNNHIVNIKTIDKAVSRILYVKFKAGLFENPFVNEKEIKAIIHSPEHVKLAKKMADESIVLLQNNNNLLPLNASKLNSIAVIGPNANQVQFGDYTWSRDNKDGITILEGLKDLLPKRIKLNYAKGCDLTTLNEEGIQDAVRAAHKSDVAIVVIGTASGSLARDYSNSTSGEGFDLSNLNPTGVQQQLVEAVTKTGKPVIVVLVQGKPFSIPWIKDHVPAIVEAWYPGEKGGQSIAEILFGKINPSGRIPVSFPRSVGHLPCYYDYLPTDKGYYGQRGRYGKPGRDYVFSDPAALWSFGYGLSYTTFSYKKIELENKNLSFNDTLIVSVNVENTGEREGKETVQLYIRQEYCSVTRPVKELKAFKKISIEPGETKQVNFKLKLKDLGYYNNKGKYLLEPGKFFIMVGSSSEDIKFKKTIEIL